MQRREHTPATVSVASTNLFTDYGEFACTTDQRVIGATARVHNKYWRDLARAARLAVKPVKMVRPPPPPPIRVLRRSLSGCSSANAEDAPC